MRGLVRWAWLAFAFGAVATAEAQSTKTTTRPPTTSGATTQNTIRPTGGDNRNDANKPLRPAGEPLRVQNIPPELRKLLQDWEVASAKIKKLNGLHRRWEYDYVFNVSKHSTGKFYYESPDKGRIDLAPDDTKAGQTETRVHWETGKPVQFKIQAGPAERWYCDGRWITQVDDQQKQATRMQLPPQNQGENIIDGPLPFLFGMPAEKAVQRYNLTLKQPMANGTAILRAIPLWAADAANYQLAEIILDTVEFVPKAVRLIDPAGTKETVFTFGKVEKNKAQNWFSRDPFKFEDRGYKVVNKLPIDERVQHLNGANAPRGPVTPAGASRPANPTAASGSEPDAITSLPKEDDADAARVPSVIGLEWKQAKTILETLGYKVSLKRGSVANRDAEVHRVERQQPLAKALLPAGETVTLWLFIAAE
jgi:TIGR03009 family protein